MRAGGDVLNPRAVHRRGKFLGRPGSVSPSPRSVTPVWKRLRKAKPQPKGGASVFASADEFWPQDNEAEKAELRKKLLQLPTAPGAGARQTLNTLEQKHGCRREWVWAN